MQKSKYLKRAIIGFALITWFWIMFWMFIIPSGFQIEIVSVTIIGSCILSYKDIGSGVIHYGFFGGQE